MSDWLTYSPISGHGNGIITITANTLSSLEDRVATIIVSNSQYSLSASTSVTQKGVQLTAITFENLTWSTDVDWGGGTATSANCSFSIIAKYSDNSTKDITNLANVTGSLAVPATTATTRQSVGTLTLTATYEDKTCTGNVEVYQEAPSLSEIFFNNLEWVTDVSATGGTATKDNCSYTIFAKYSNNIQVDVTSEATVSGSLVVPISTKLTRQVVGTLSLTAEYENLTCNGSVTAYQEAPSLSDIYFDNLIWVTDVSGTGGTATKDNCSYTIFAKYSNNIQVDVTSEAEVTGSLVVEYSIIEERHSAGTLMLTAKYENLTCNGSVTVYQEANYRDYLKFTFVSGGTWIYPNSKEKIEYSINNGKWIRIEGKKLSVLSGDTIRVRGTNNVYDNNTFGGTAYFNLSGNIMALIGGVNYENLKELNYSRAFQQIFANSNVVEASELLLPATELSEYCYRSMFSGCTSLTTAPALPATTLAQYCYYSMFEGCTSLTTAPELPATTLVSSCYQSMFENCTSLNYIKCLATDISAYYCTSGWVYGVASTGTFVKSPNMTEWATGDNGIPSGWTVTNAS